MLHCNSYVILGIAKKRYSVRKYSDKEAGQVFKNFRQSFIGNAVAIRRAIFVVRSWFQAYNIS